jgi:peptidoglycan/xylan/chitin deacetylase (PgdA/CDA1 family)
MSRWLSPLLFAGGVYRRRWREPALRGRAIVLNYHRIARPGGHGEPPGYGVENGIPVDVFEKQLRFMLRHFRPVRASELGEPLGEEGPCFAVTFDDGYEDNLTLAGPVLERLGVTATLFATTDYIGTDRLFWWESLGAMMRETRTPGLEVGAVAPDLVARWPMPARLGFADDAERGEAHWRVSMALMRTPPGEIDGALRDLAAALEVPLRTEGRDSPLLSWDQVRAWRTLGQEVGAHTRTHANLGLLEDPEDEVQGSFEKLEAELDAPVPTFAYPYGGPEHRSAAAVRAVEAAGGRHAFTTDLGTIGPESDRWSLPRTGLSRGWAFVCAYQVDEAFTVS